MPFTRPLCALFGSTLLGLSAHAASTWYVDVHATAPGDGSHGSPYTSIQYAIDQTSVMSGDTLLVAPGDYVENVDMHYKSLTVRSIAGSEVTTIRPAQAGNVVYMTGDPAELDGFTITGFIPGGPFTAAIYVFNGEATVQHCIVRDNAGNGIMSFYDAYVHSCTVTGNTIGVHALSFGGYVDVASCIVTHNGTDLAADPSGFLTAEFNFTGAGDPGFWDYAHGDLHLRPGSVCIDAGNPAQHDPDGSVIDQGALTYVPTYAPPNTIYCTGKITSQGCVPAISSQGQASATSANAFWIYCDQAVDHKPGLLLYGNSEESIAFQGGTLCMNAQHRTPAQSSGGSACAGHWQYEMNVRIQSGLDPLLVPGRMIYVQWWGRDPLDPAGWGTQLSDALRFGILP
jgi:hypothetical protein